MSIEKHPDIVEQKIRIGDFESYLIISKHHQGALLTIVDRFSSFFFFFNVGSKIADLVTKMTIRALAPHKEWIKTIKIMRDKSLLVIKSPKPSLSIISAEVAEKLNNRPRKNLGFQTSKQVYYNYIYEKQKLALGG